MPDYKSVVVSTTDKKKNKKKKKENLFLHGKSFLDRTYPVIVEIRTERHVPIIVALPVIR